MMRPLLRLSYPEPLTDEQEDVLVSYFQAWQKQFANAFRLTAKSVRLTNKEQAQMLENLAANMNLLLRLDKSELERHYVFSCDTQLYDAVAFPLPVEVLKKLKLTSENRLEKFKGRLRMDLTGEVAKKMKVPYVECADI